MKDLKRYVEPDADPPGQPEWVSAVANRRNDFVGTGLLVIAATEMKAFKFLFATKQPLMVAMSPLEPVVDYLPDAANATPEQQREIIALPTMKFQFDWLSMVRSESLMGTTVEDVMVLPVLSYAGE